jgi:predicted transcriptional regulator
MVTTVNLPDGLHERLKQLADEEHRSMNATIVVAVEEYVSARSHRARVRDLAGEVVERDAELLRRLAQ